MKRIVVIGGTGFFGRLIVEGLSTAGLKPIVASRSGGEMRIDADNVQDLRSNLKTRDLVIDAAGPFQKRSLALIEAARTMGFDVIDLSDSADYTSMIYNARAPIQAAGIRVLTACSSLSAVSAAALKSLSVKEPRRLSAYLVPAIRHTATAATLESMLDSIARGSRTLRFPRPLGTRSGLLVKSVDAITLPKAFPTLDSAELVVDLRFPGMNLALAAARRFPFARRLMDRHRRKAMALAHTIGTTHGVLAYEIASASGYKYRIFTGEKSYMLAVLPAIQAAMAIAEGKFVSRGVVPPTEHVDAERLFDAARKEGITTIAG